jgi:hypothetical protein
VADIDINDVKHRYVLTKGSTQTQVCCWPNLIEPASCSLAWTSENFLSHFTMELTLLLVCCFHTIASTRDGCRCDNTRQILHRSQRGNREGPSTLPTCHSSYSGSFGSGSQEDYRDD